ncbi:hypothetical protein HPB50_006053 [Hyalomma asiaticum]|uniref:Uncharacterized protein n=1 Tax=Hyalomma asiaticum TaxID=266040 RepID=A0ACB7SH33_HYAAI|nr:hypothetical protein HPB50_006053 [Hyalomma asiaticum]
MARKQSHRFVPGCTTGYKSSKKKHALFGVVKDEALFAQWRRAIPRADKLLQENSAVCELHFDERYISRHFEHTVNGDIVRIERARPLLLPGAVPTQFPNLPHYLSKKLPAIRKRAARCVAPAPPRKKTAWDGRTPVSADTEVALDNRTPESVDTEDTFCFSFDDLALPSVGESTH